MPVHSIHSNFIIKSIEKNIIREKSSITVKETIGKTVTRTTQDRMSRFKNPVFKQAVRTALIRMGFDNPTYKDFNYIESIFEGKIDWIEYAKYKEPANTISCERWLECLADVEGYSKKYPAPVCPQ